jgi:hypothetical protein
VSFTVEFPHGPEDTCYFAYSYPFTTTDQAAYLEEVVADPRRG